MPGGYRNGKVLERGEGALKVKKVNPTSTTLMLLAPFLSLFLLILDFFGSLLTHDHDSNVPRGPESRGD